MGKYRNDNTRMVEEYHNIKETHVWDLIPEAI